MLLFLVAHVVGPVSLLISHFRISPGPHTDISQQHLAFYPYLMEVRSHTVENVIIHPSMDI